ncbi:MAG: 30S ribosomal protein S1 [Ignavibacteriales bacterium]|nr:30S ribosomal protein S1 [Ignavibacteriales bacterium]
MSEEQNAGTLSARELDYEKSKRQFFDEEYSKDEFEELANLYAESINQVKEGELIKGNVLRKTDDNVIIDIGFKSEGAISNEEFQSVEELQPGDEIEVVLERLEDRHGNLVLSKKRADFLRIWERVLNAYENDDVLRGRIVRRIKGGMVVDLFGMEAFLPGSQIDVRPIRDFDAYVGKEMDFKVVKVNIPTENVVVSHKVLVEAELAGQRKQILESLERGQILEGVVKAITDFGVFVDLGGVDGLVHITDLSWGRINHPSEVVKLDETINVVVTDFDEEKKRISLSLKKLLPHPWENIDEKYHEGEKVAGRVVSLTDYGAFIELEKGIEGLIHNSEMSWTQHIKHPSQMVTMGQIVDAVILNLDTEDKKISLGMKQLEPDPWDELMQKYPIGSRQKGVARNLTNFGVFVELEPGIDGLVHISDLSWTKKIRHPGEVVKKGDEIEVVVLAIDIEQRKISLGHKQVHDNPWDTFERNYEPGVDVPGKIVRVIDKGVIVELPEEVDGFVPQNQLAGTRVKNIAQHFEPGQDITVRVIEFDKDSKKIVLSPLAYLKEQPNESVEEYIEKHNLEGQTPQDFANAKSPFYGSKPTGNNPMDKLKDYIPVDKAPPPEEEETTSEDETSEDETEEE